MQGQAACAPCEAERLQDGRDFVRWWMHNGFVNGAAASQRASYLPAPRSSLRGRFAGGRAAGKRRGASLFDAPLQAPPGVFAAMQHAPPATPAPRELARVRHISRSPCSVGPSGEPALCPMPAVDSEKMSKSLGNFFTIRDVLARYHALALRWFLVATHYRAPVSYSLRGLDEARARPRPDAAQPSSCWARWAHAGTQVCGAGVSSCTAAG